jgi:mycothiol synthase
VSDGPPSGVQVRRVGFRFGTDAELASQLLVESEIEAERHPGSVAQPLESYRAFARSLPSQFDDHAWLAEEADGTPAACAACWTNTAGDPQVMPGYVYVRRAWRRRGIGWRLTRAVVDETRREGRATLVWSTSGAIPAGEVFSHRIGGAVGRVNRTSELWLRDVDWERVHAWSDQGPRRAAGYRLEFWDGPLPDDLIADAARFHRLMNAQPRDDLAVGDVVLDTAQVAEVYRHLAETGRERWTIFVRDPEGWCVGGTEMTFDPWEPETAHQQNTATDPEHRGLGLAKWAKAAMLERLGRERPQVTRVRTGNAFSNDAMLAINTALGFAVTEVRTEWQARVPDLDARVARVGG